MSKKLKKILKRLKNFFGFYSYSSQFKRHFDLANSRSALSLSSIVIVLELYMIGYVLFNLITGNRVFPPKWVLFHLPVYVLLLSIAIIQIIFSIKYLQGKKLSRTFGHIVTSVFSVYCLVFGIYISVLDWAKGSQILAFVTMEVFVFGFFIWRPWISIPLLTSSFAAFYWFANDARPVSFGFTLNFVTFYIGLLAASISRYHQKINEAKREAQLDDITVYLENLAVTDDVTGIPNMLSFRTKVEEIRSTNRKDYNLRAFLFLDVQNFSNYNEKYGFSAGTNLLRVVANTVKTAFSEDPVAHLSDDHFVAFSYRQTMEQKIKNIRSKIESLDNEVNLGLKVGAYIPSASENTPANIACDYARYACDSIKNHFDKNYIEYTKETADEIRRKQYIINNIDNAIENEWIKVYYQPVILSENKKVCGYEALARWIDPIYGFLSPADFITILEENRLIHKLDSYVVRRVCKDIKNAPELNIPILPVSLNFSRLDFELMDIETLLKECVEDNNIDKSLIHIEVTESALSSDDKTIQKILKNLRAKNYALWLDDFGSGYSSLNTLREYEFDMMKIDMKFVRDFEKNQKSKPILKNIISLAEDIGMATLTEGVETEATYEYLKKIGCNKMQGYLFGKPMPVDELVSKLHNGQLTV